MSVKCSNIIPLYKHLKQYFLSIYAKHLIIFFLTVSGVASDVVFIWFANSVVM